MKSLFAFAYRLSYLAFDVGRVVKRPKLKDTLAERMLIDAASISTRDAPRDGHLQSPDFLDVAQYPA